MTTDPQLPRSAPEAQGIASSAINAFIEAVERHVESLHSVMLMRHGHVVAEGWWAPYERDTPHMLFSLSKSFTSTAIGLAAAEGLLSVDDPVIAFFPDELPGEVSVNLKAMRVRHLLSMSTGHIDDTMPVMERRTDGNWVRAFFELPVQRAPGTHFCYNTGASYMLSAIIQQVTGDTLLSYLRPRLLDPLGITQATWQSCPRGINTGGYGLSATTDAVARFGQLYLQRGMWRGQRILPDMWVEAASALQTPNGDDLSSDWAQGYGYQLWRCRHGAYRGDGAFGQYCVIMPEQDAVLAITSGLLGMQVPLDLAWEHLLPALGPAPLSADGVAHAALAARLANLRLPVPQGRRPRPALAEQVSGRAYAIAPNGLGIAMIVFQFTAAGCELTIRDGHGEHRLAAGDGAWRIGTTTFGAGASASRIAAAGVWVAPGSYRLAVYYTETPFGNAATFRFAGDRLLVQDFGQNVSFDGPIAFPDLEGRAS